jgi:transposase
MEDQYTEEVKKLKEQGLSERKIAEHLNISRNQVRNALHEIKIEEAGEDTLPEDKMRSIIREELKHAREEEEEEGKSNGGFPMMRKAGAGMEVTAPEAVLVQYMGGSDAELAELKAIMKFRAAMLMVMDLVDIQKGLAEADARRMEPVLKLMKETREEQDAAAARAKASSEEIADRAAQATAGQLYEAINQNQGQVNSSLEKIKQMIGGQSSDPFSQMVSMMQSMQQMSSMFGMPMPGMMPGGAPGTVPPGAAAAAEPPPIERHNIKEWEGK